MQEHLLVHGVRDLTNKVEMHLHCIAPNGELDPQVGQVRYDAAVVSSKGAGPNRYVLSYLNRMLNQFHLR